VYLYVGIRLPYVNMVGLEKKVLENPHMTACHKFRPSMNLDEFDSLQGSSDPSNATGATSSAVMRANLQQNNCSIYMRVCLVRVPVASHTWQYPPPLAFRFTRIPVELCVSTLHKLSQQLTGISKTR